jgi:fibronectin-binding autotransporter adhesin
MSNPSFRPILLVLVFLSVLSTGQLSAQTYTWTNGAGGEWTNTANWDPSTNYARNLVGVTALFGDFAGVGNNIAVTMAGGVTTLGAQTVSFSGDDNYTLGATNGGKLRLAGTTQLVSATGSGAHTILSPLTFGIQSSSSNAVATISNASSGVMTINRLEGLGTGADHQLVVTGSGNTVFNTGVFNPGAQTFSVDVVKSGAGTLTFNSAPGAAINQGITINGGAVVLTAVSTNYTGGTTVNDGGRLVVGAVGAIDAGTLALNNGGTLQLGNAGSGSVTGSIGNNGTVTFNFASGTTVTNEISGSGRVVHEQGQRVSLSGANTYAGGTRILSSGSSEVYLAVNSDGNLGDALGNLTFAGAGRGTLRIDAVGFSSARSILLEDSGGRLAVGSAGDAALFSGSISGAGGLTAGIASGVGGNTAGIITLSGALSYSGPTAVAFGSLVLSNGAGTTNALSGGFATGSGALVKDGAGVLEVAGGNAATGLLTIRGGTVRTAAANLYGSGNITMTNAAVLEATESFTLSRRLIAGSATGGTNSVGVVSVAEGKALTMNAGGGGVGGVGQLVKRGEGTLILASSNNINNGTSSAMVLEAGTLVVTNTGTLGNQGANVYFAMSGGALDLGTTTQVVGGFTVNAGTVSNGTISNSGNFNVSSGTISASLAGASANLTKTGSGTATLSGNNTYGGNTLVDGGTLLLSGTGSLAASQTISIAAGAALDVSAVDGGLSLAGGQAIGGAGMVLGDLSFASGSKIVFSLTETLTVSGGTVSFEDFGLSDLVGFDSSVALGSYKLMAGDAVFDFANISNFGAGDAFDLGDGKFAYFSAGSLDVNVVPEPSVWSLVGLCVGFFLSRFWLMPRRRAPRG